MIRNEPKSWQDGSPRKKQTWCKWCRHRGGEQGDGCLAEARGRAVQLLPCHHGPGQRHWLCLPGTLRHSFAVTYIPPSHPLHPIPIISALQSQCLCCPSSHCASTDDYLLTDSTDIWQNMSRGNSPHCSGCIESTSSMHHLSCKLIFVVTLKRCLCLCLGSLFSPIKHSSTRCRGCDRGDKQIYKFAGGYMYASVQHVL